jgi:hypothetical protein
MAHRDHRVADQRRVAVGISAAQIFGLAAAGASVATQPGSALVVVHALHTATTRVAHLVWTTGRGLILGCALGRPAVATSLSRLIAHLIDVAGDLGETADQAAGNLLDAIKMDQVATHAQRAVDSSRADISLVAVATTAERAEKTGIAFAISRAFATKTGAQATGLIDCTAFFVGTTVCIDLAHRQRLAGSSIGAHLASAAIDRAPATASICSRGRLALTASHADRQNKLDGLP